MKDRLHEILAQCAVIHNTLIDKNIIFDIEEVQEELKAYEDDIKEHYLMLLMQYYFQKNNLSSLKVLILQGYKFEIRFEDISEAFIHIQNNDSVIEFYEDQVVLLKDIILEEHLLTIKEYYENNEELRSSLKFSLELIKRNRYVCAYAYKHRVSLGDFFINEDLLESLKRDLPYLLK